MTLPSKPLPNKPAGHAQMRARLLARAQHQRWEALRWLADDEQTLGRAAATRECRIVRDGRWIEGVLQITDGLTDMHGRLAMMSADRHALALLALDARRLEHLRILLAGPFATVARCGRQFGVSFDVVYESGMDEHDTARRVTAESLAIAGRYRELGAIVTLATMRVRATMSPLLNLQIFVPAQRAGALAMRSIARDVAAAGPVDRVCHPGFYSGVHQAEQVHPEMRWGLESGAARPARTTVFAAGRLALPFVPALHWLGFDAAGHAAWCASPLLHDSPFARAIADERSRIKAAGGAVC